MPPEERPVSRAEIPGMRKGLEEEEENGAAATARGEVDEDGGGGGDTASPNGEGNSVDISAVMASVRSGCSLYIPW